MTDAPYPFPDTSLLPSWLVANIPRVMQHAEKIRDAMGRYERARYGRDLMVLFPLTHGHLGEVVEREIEFAKTEIDTLLWSTPSVFRGT